MYFVYILKCKDKSLYTGITTDIRRRFAEHRTGKGGAYTRSHGALQLVYTEKVRNRSKALKREHTIKNLTRPQKLEFIKFSKSKKYTKLSGY